MKTGTRRGMWAAAWALLLVVGVGDRAEAGTFYVATNGNGSAGTNWFTAHTNLQTTLDAAAAGDTICVAGHTFVITSQVDWVKSDLTVLGGYAATNVADLPGPYDAERWPTIITRTGGTTRILYLHNLTNAVLRRVTLHNGYTTQAYGWGAGLYIGSATGVILSASRIVSNACYQGGANVEYAAGIFATNSFVLMSNCVVQANTGSGYYNVGILGGGLFLTGNSRWSIVDSVIAGNGGSSGSSGKGGGLYVVNGVHQLRNCVVAANHTYAAAGLHVAGGTVTVQNASIVANNGQGVSRAAGTLAVTNSILWGNGDDVTGTVTLAYCNIEDGDSNGVNGCFSADPRFERGLYLASGSSCINTGSDTAVNLGWGGYTTLAAGTPDSGIVDLGYHFTTGIDWNVADLYVATNGLDSNLGTTAAQPFLTLTRALSAAGVGSRIHVAAGTYPTNSGNVFPLSLTQWGLQLIGTNRDATVIQAPGVDNMDRRVLDVDNVLGDGLIEGLTVTGGRTDMTFGGGLSVQRSMLLLNDCAIRGNRSRYNVYQKTSRGGGVYAFASTLTITNCLVRDNEAYNNQANSLNAGGGVHVQNGFCTIVDSVIRNNLCYSYSGGPGYGGNLYFLDGQHRVFNTQVLNAGGRFGDSGAGGIEAEQGGLLYLQIANCTVAGNIRQGISRRNGTVVVTNSIVWDNTDDIFGTVGLFFSNIEDGDNNTTNGCISADPRFERGVYLASGSPCRDAGGDTAAAVGLGGYTTWADGTPEAGTVDLGYHAKSGLSGTTADLYVSTNGDNGNTGTNWTQALRSITAALAKAADGTRIHVASGTYSNNYETFPLVLNRPGLQILGTNRNDTIISATGANQRVFTVQGTAGDAKLEGLTITGGNLPNNSSSGHRRGGGLYLESGALCLDTCTVSNNYVGGSQYQYQSAGGGIYALNATLMLTNTIIAQNRVYQNQANSSVLGGGLASLNSLITIVECAFSRNQLDVGSASARQGAGLYLEGGTHRVRNTVVAGNARTSGTASISGVGLYALNADVRLENCSVVTNYASGTPQGIYQSGGAVWVTNSIVWGNGADCANFDHDGLILTKVHDSCMGDGQNNGIQGCTNADPLFVDTVYCHLRSHAGQYQGGFFTNGTWGQDATTNSPYIDAGRVGVAYAREPNPNGRRLNWGAYGNTPVASKTFLEEPGVFTVLTVHSYGPSEIGANSAKLTGEVVHQGGVENPEVYLCWDNSDKGSSDTNAWTYVAKLGTYPAFELFSTNMTGLSGGAYFRFFVTNSSGSDWSAPVDSVILALPPTVTNNGATSVRRRTAILNGRVTFTGGVDPDTYFYYGFGGGALTNIVAAGPQDDVFSYTLTGLAPGTTYDYRAYASNSAGTAWSDLQSFRTLTAGPIGWYVATNGANTDGTNWTTALTGLQLALDTAEPNDTILVAGGQTFRPLPFYAFVWTTSWVTVEGGYQASGATPGARDPLQWPTILTRDSTGGGRSRVLTVQAVTNGVLRGVTITGGLPADSGAPSVGGGIYLTGSVFLVDACTITNNKTPISLYQSTSAGGGIYALNSMLTVSNCLIATNWASQTANANSNVRGGGLALYGSTSMVVRTVIRDNILTEDWANSGLGGGVFVSGGLADLRNCLLIGNRRGDTYPVDGAGLYAASGITRLMHVTVVTNDLHGVWRAGGTLSITNSILWANGMDATGTMTIAWSDVGVAAPDVTLNNSISTNPLFVDTAYYHLQSRSGYYAGGYFSGGSWDTTVSFSSCIDKGDPASDYLLEPHFNGRRANLGAYGNTEVASKSPPPPGTIFILK